MLDDNPHRAPHFAAAPAFGRDEFRSAVRADQVHLGRPVAEHMHMHRIMIVELDHHPQTLRRVDRDHLNNLSRWVIQ